MRIRALIAAGALFAGLIAPLAMTESASAGLFEVNTVCLEVSQTDGCIDAPASSTAVLQIDSGYVYTVDTDGIVTNQFSDNTLDVDYYHDTILEFFTLNGSRCIRVNASAPDQPVLGSPGAACEFVLASGGQESRLVSIGSSNDNGGSSPYYLQTRSLAKGSYMSTDTVTNGRYTEWGI